MTEFIGLAERRKQRRARDREKDGARVRAWKQNNVERNRTVDRAARLKRLYNISIAQYDAMLEAQDGKCAACHKLPVEGKILGVDHCHRTGKVRALLCDPCNNHLGVYENHRQKFEDYLERYGVRET